MGKNTYQTCVAIMTRLRQEGLEHGATHTEILNIISVIAGGTRDTKLRYLKELQKRRFIRKSDVNTYELNHAIAEEEEELGAISELSGRLNSVDGRVADLEAYHIEELSGRLNNIERRIIGIETNQGGGSDA